MTTKGKKDWNCIRMLTVSLCIFVITVTTAYKAHGFAETAPSSVFKHDIMDSLANSADASRVIDMFGGSIWYANSGKYEIGGAGRIMMNGYVKSIYIINDMAYPQPEECTLSPGTAKYPGSVIGVRSTTNQFPDPKTSSFGDGVFAYYNKYKSPGSGKNMVIIDPYAYISDTQLQRILDSSDISKTDVLVIFSPRDRSSIYGSLQQPRPDIIVYSLVKPGTLEIKTNRDGKALTYTLFIRGEKDTGSIINGTQKQFGEKMAYRRLAPQIWQVFLDNDSPPPYYPPQYWQGISEICKCLKIALPQ